MSDRILSVCAGNIPEELRSPRQWMVRRKEKRGECLTKVPHQTNGQRAKSDTPETWTGFDEAFSAYQAGQFDDVGFVFAPGGGDRWKSTLMDAISP